MQSGSFAVLSALVLSGSLAGCAAKPPAAPPPPGVTVAPVLERDITEWDEFSGRLEPVNEVEIRPRVSGYMKRVTYPAVKEVRWGETLFEIDPRPYEAQLVRAVDQLEQDQRGA